MQGNLIVRLLGLAVIAACIAYIVHLQSENSRLQGQLDLAKAGGGRPAAPAARPQNAAPPAAARPAAPQAAASGPPRTLEADKRQAMIEKLGGPGSSMSNPVWFATTPNNAEASAFQKQLQSAFQDAGWVVKGNVPVRFNMKPGVYIFSADENPPNYVTMAQDGLEAAGIEIVSSGRGYRDFYDAKKKDNPDWIGFELAPDQSYVIVIGRKPEPGTATPSPQS